MHVIFFNIHFKNIGPYLEIMKPRHDTLFNGHIHEWVIQDLDLHQGRQG